MVLKSNEAMGLSQPPKSQWMQTLPQVLAVSVKNILLLAFGMTLGFPTILIPGLLAPEEEFTMTPEEISWISSINLICVPVGSIVSGSVSQAIGRKKAMQVVNLPFLAAWLLFRFCNAEWQVFVALAMTGLSGGFLEAPVLTYVAEVTQPRLRGVLSSTSSMAVIGGILIMFLLGTFFPWRTVALMSCIFNVMSFVFLFFVPESPHWLISNNRLLDARKSLAWLRGWTDLDAIEPEYKQIYREVRTHEEDHSRDNPAFDGSNGTNGTITNGGLGQTQLEQNGNQPKSEPTRKGPSTWDTAKLFTKKSFLWPFSLVCTVFFINHVTGMTTLQIYAVPIFQSVNAPIDRYYATVILGSVELLGSICSTALVAYTGKRLLNFVSILGIGVCFTVVAIYAQLNNLTQMVILSKGEKLTNATSMSLNTTILENIPDNMTGNLTVNKMTATLHGSEYSWIPMTFLIGVAFMAHFGVRILPWILTGEVFSIETRAAAAGLCSAFTYILSFAANKAFVFLVGILTLPGMFFTHAVLAGLAFVVLYFFLPETEGKTLGQINEHFSGGTKMGDKVYREKTDKNFTLKNAYVNNANNLHAREEGTREESKM